jgi:hypothetical protein
MAEILILSPPGKDSAVRRLEESIAALGYAVAVEQVGDQAPFPDVAARAAAARATLLIWSRPLVSLALVEDKLAALRQVPGLIEVSADGITPPDGNEQRVALISGWRGQPFHPGWASIVGRLEQRMGTSRGPAARAASARPGRPVATAAKPRRRAPVAGGAALALLVIGAGTAWVVETRPAGAPAHRAAPFAAAPQQPPPASGSPAPQSQPEAPAQPTPTAGNPGAQGNGIAITSGADQPPQPVTGSVNPEGHPARPGGLRAPEARESSALKPSRIPAKRYSAKNSRVMRLFCRGAGRSTPQCRVFLRATTGARHSEP